MQCYIRFLKSDLRQILDLSVAAVCLKVPPMWKCTHLKRNAFRDPVLCDFNGNAFHDSAIIPIKFKLFCLLALQRSDASHFKLP